MWAQIWRLDLFFSSFFLYVPPHSTVAILYGDIFVTSNTVKVLPQQSPIGSTVFSSFFSPSISLLYSYFLLSVLNISFTTFVSQRENYILTVHVCNQKERNMHILWLRRDLPIGLHTALCCPTNDLLCRHGVSKCSLLLTSYFLRRL